MKETIRVSGVVYCNKTGLPVDGEQHWAWTFVTNDEVLSWVDESRGGGVLEHALSEKFAGDSTLSCDGWSAYSIITRNFSGAGRTYFGRLSTLLKGKRMQSGYLWSCAHSTTT